MKYSWTKNGINLIMAYDGVNMSSYRFLCSLFVIGNNLPYPNLLNIYLVN